MIHLMLAIFLAIGPCHANTATTVKNNTVISLTDDTGGDTGHIPNFPTPPPPPIPPVQ